MTSSFHGMRLGAFSLTIIKDGSGGRRPLTDLVAEIPEDLEDRRIFMEGGLMMVDTPGERLLVDAGNGPNRGPRRREAEAAFRDLGITPESIDTILLTHGDPDHISGLLDSHGRLVYPRAHIVLCADLWDAFRSEPEAGLYFAGQSHFLRTLTDRIADRVTCFGTEGEVRPGITAVPAPGHRTGHAVFRFESEDNVLYHIGDAAFDPLFLERTDLVVDMEYRPREARATRERLANRMSGEGAWIVGSHFDVSNVGTLARTDRANRFVWHPPETTTA